ncbi:MAG: tetratricopeptide repeat protein [Clostridiaceae bacterium]|nr:tetratricopeptide repeat protein [Clostridiaceae bacterium]
MYNKKNGKISILAIIISASVAAFVLYVLLIYFIFNSGSKNSFNKGKKLLNQSDYYGAINYFNQAEKSDKKNSILYLNLGEAYFRIKKYEEALTNFNKSLAITSTNPNAFAFKAYDYVMLENYVEADKFCAEALKLDPKNAFAYNVKGQISYSKYNDEDALTNFDKAIKLNKNYYEPYINKIKTIYDEKEYLNCITFSKETLKKFPKSVEIYKYISNCFSQLEKHEDAISELNLALEIDPKDPDLLSSIGWEYFYNKNSSQASTFAKKALSIDPELKDALDLLDSIDKDSLSEAVKIVNFIKTNYLYFDKVIDFDKKAKAFEDLKTLTTKDITNFIEDIKIKDDNFTFTLTDSDFNHRITEKTANEITSKSLKENTFYLKINSFNNTVDLDFQDVLVKIKNPEQMNLVIDLRNNSGGVISAANNILDVLLPKCTTSFTINRTGSTHSYYSDEKQIKFKKIIILVNEYTASSSELLTLGLKKYLNNVVIIGHTTFGKGVGQLTYDNADKKYSIFLVSFYWNVKESNIAGTGIMPDIAVNGTSDSYYINKVT